MNLLGLRIAPAADVNPIGRVEQAELLNVLSRRPGCRSVQIHQAVGALAVADEREEPVGQIGKEKPSDDGYAEGDPEIHANTGADETTAGEMLPEHQGSEGLIDQRAGKPEKWFSHFDGVVKSNREPLGRRARNERKGEKCSEKRAEIPAALPAGPIGEHVTRRSDFAVLHGMPPRTGVYIAVYDLAKSLALIVLRYIFMSSRGVDILIWQISLHLPTCIYKSARLSVRRFTFRSGPSLVTLYQASDPCDEEQR